MSTNIWNIAIDEVNAMVGGADEVVEVKTELYALLAHQPNDTMLDLEQVITAYADAHALVAFRLGLEAGRNPFALILPDEVK